MPIGDLIFGRKPPAKGARSEPSKNANRRQASPEPPPANEEDDGPELVGLGDDGTAELEPPEGGAGSDTEPPPGGDGGAGVSKTEAGPPEGQHEGGEGGGVPDIGDGGTGGADGGATP